MKIIFLNTWNCNLEKDIGKFLKKHTQDTDVFCLQEAFDKTKLLCQDILSGYVLVTDSKYISDDNQFSPATYVKKGIEIISSQPLLKTTPQTGLALHAQLKYKNKLINICNVHGLARPSDKLDNENRLRQSREIIKLYKGLTGLKIIGGDFNLEITTKSVGLFEENGYVNLIKKYKIPTTRNRLVWDKYPDNKQYFADYVFVTPALSLTGFSVPDIEISDHLPMILKIK